MKRFRNTRIAALVLACALSLSPVAIVSCGAVAAVVSVLPSVIKLLTTTDLVLDTIHDHVDTYEDLSKAAKDDIHAAIEHARDTFDIVREVAKTAKSFNDGDMVEALANARKAYDAVLALCEKHGVAVQPTEGPGLGLKVSGPGAGQVLIVPSVDRMMADAK